MPRTAVYLVGQGPKREPRPIELQLARIRRYTSALEEKLGKTLPFGSDDIYIDLNENRALVSLSALERLIGLIKDGKYDTVIVDIGNSRVFNPYEFDFLWNTLQRLGVRLFNASDDDEDAMNDFLAKRFQGNANIAIDGMSDATDFICFYPRLASRIINSAFRTAPDERSAQQAVRKRAAEIAERNPYAGGSKPILEESLIEEFWQSRLDRLYPSLRRESQLSRALRYIKHWFVGVRPRSD